MVRRERSVELEVLRYGGVRELVREGFVIHLQGLESVRGFVADEIGSLREGLADLDEDGAEAGERGSKRRRARALLGRELVLAAPQADEFGADADDGGEAGGHLAGSTSKESEEFFLVEIPAEDVVGVVAAATAVSRRATVAGGLLGGSFARLAGGAFGLALGRLGRLAVDAELFHLLLGERLEASHATEEVSNDAALIATAVVRGGVLVGGGVRGGALEAVERAEVVALEGLGGVREVGRLVLEIVRERARGGQRALGVVQRRGRVRRRLRRGAGGARGLAEGDDRASPDADARAKPRRGDARARGNGSGGGRRATPRATRGG